MDCVAPILIFSENVAVIWGWPLYEDGYYSKNTVIEARSRKIVLGTLNYF